MWISQPNSLLRLLCDHGIPREYWPRAIRRDIEEAEVYDGRGVVVNSLLKQLGMRRTGILIMRGRFIWEATCSTSPNTEQWNADDPGKT